MHDMSLLNCYIDICYEYLCVVMHDSFCFNVSGGWIYAYVLVCTSFSHGELLYMHTHY